ncbi:MAG: hypothetical protein ACR2NW_10165 [Thermodesulfobacteriota bacterium]
MKKIIYILAVLPLMYLTSYAQDTPTTPTQPAPDAFPDYIVRPSEDLNPYGMSSLGTSTEDGYREGSGTLGTKTTGRPSNRDVNKKYEEKRAKNKANENKQQTQSIEEIEIEDTSAVENFSSTPKSGNSNMIRWVDEDGVTHITNNVGSVPAKYRDSIQ